MSSDQGHTYTIDSWTYVLVTATTCRAWRAASGRLMNVISVLNGGRLGTIYRSHYRFPSPWTNSCVGDAESEHFGVLPTFLWSSPPRLEQFLFTKRVMSSHLLLINLIVL